MNCLDSEKQTCDMWDVCAGCGTWAVGCGLWAMLRLCEVNCAAILRMVVVCQRNGKRETGKGAKVV